MDVRDSRMASSRQIVSTFIFSSSALALALSESVSEASQVTWRKVSRTNSACMWMYISKQWDVHRPCLMISCTVALPEFTASLHPPERNPCSVKRSQKESGRPQTLTQPRNVSRNCVAASARAETVQRQTVAERIRQAMARAPNLSPAWARPRCYTAAATRNRAQATALDRAAAR